MRPCKYSYISALGANSENKKAKANSDSKLNNKNKLNPVFKWPRPNKNGILYFVFCRLKC
jgi:hypothetical protein